jgi:hypothetical protein
MARSLAVRDHIPLDGCDPGNAGLHFGERTGYARMANFADAPDLPADAELLHLESNFARDQRRMGQLGQTGAHRERAGASVGLKFAVLRFPAPTLAFFWRQRQPLRATVDSSHQAYTNAALSPIAPC